ncbi:hypothetical protein E0H90_12930 [Acinetobacter sp. ANC 3791]|nr:hypothetical protein E0H90_12930 [Acinetobacter sp. ANC 3791]
MANKRWSLIIALVIYSLFQTWQVNSQANDLNKADAKCTTKVNQVQDELNQYKADQKEANEKAKTAVDILQQQWSEQLLKVEQNASKKIQDAAAAASNAQLANSRLSEQISRANQHLPTASNQALIDYSTTTGKLLEACTAEYRTMAEKADGHAIDAERLSQAWDVIVSKEKPSK